jgi:two-component system, OmpR family, response regulator VicR
MCAELSMNGEPRRLEKLHIDAVDRKVWLEDREIKLTTREYEIVLLLVSNPEIIFTRKQLLEKVWGYEYYGESRAIDIQMRRLRNKLETDPANPKYILTRWGEGYYYRNNL